ncbi:class I SAM-dependent methyltransferase [Streptomyces sp. NPDC056987]|uniref:class I SAM-dependent methyltransferase n=1 Tax=Streptomyces sp. NPDC056987 TaxID=3345988 RepID=UPI003640BF32
MDTESWDKMYRGRDRVFSGAPNGVLVAEVTGMPPGQALDVGCGEGADALWLARQGWQVTAVDLSRTALERAAAEATDVVGRVAWARADLTATPPPADAFDLVSAQYFPLLREPGHAALRGLLDAVAPGGTLLFATHDLADLSPHPDQGFDPGAYYRPDDIAGLLGHDWTVLINESRPRTTPAPKGTGHRRDTVLRAQRPRSR